MITLIKNLPDNIIGFRYKGKVTAKDYEKVLFPEFEKAHKKGKQIKVLWVLEKDFDAFTMGAVWDDMEMGIKYFRDWIKIAFVSDKKWMNHTVRAFGFLIPGHVRTFKNKKMDDAIKWLLE